MSIAWHWWLVTLIDILMNTGCIYVMVICGMCTQLKTTTNKTKTITDYWGGYGIRVHKFICSASFMSYLHGNAFVYVHSVWILFVMRVMLCKCRRLISRCVIFILHSASDYLTVCTLIPFPDISWHIYFRFLLILLVTFDVSSHQWGKRLNI